MFKYKSLLAAATLVALIMVGCNENTTTVDTPPNPISGLMATSINESTVRLKWTAPTGSYSSYIIRYNSTASDSMKVTAPSGTEMLDISSLTSGTVYTFTVTSLNSDNLESTTKSMKWAGAMRFATYKSGLPIRLYENSSSKGSGLQLYDDVTGEPKNLKVDAGDFWDIGIDNKGLTDSLYSGSPTQLTGINFTTSRLSTFIGKDYSGIDSLNQVFESSDLVATTDDAIRYPNLSPKGFVFVVKTANGNYAKVFIKPNANGEILQGTPGDRYVEVEISYQKIKAVPHAGSKNTVGN